MGDVRFMRWRDDCLIVVHPEYAPIEVDLDALIKEWHSDNTLADCTSIHSIDIKQTDIGLEISS